MSKQKIAVIGSGGHCRSVIPLLKLNDFLIEGIYDNSFRKGAVEVIQRISLKGTLAMMPSDLPTVLAIGDNKYRKEIFLNNYSQILKDNCIHPKAYLDQNCKTGEANLLFGNVFINAEANLGNNNIINTGAIIEHEVIIGDHCHISIGAIIAGRVKIGNSCFIGAGAKIKDKIKIVDNVTIGVGAVVVKDILEPGVYVGVPAIKIK